MINRAALILKSKQPLVDWINRVDPNQHRSSPHWDWKTLTEKNGLSYQ